MISVDDMVRLAVAISPAVLAFFAFLGTMVNQHQIAQTAGLVRANAEAANARDRATQAAVARVGLVAEEAVDENTTKLEEVRVHVNSMKDELVRVTGEAERAKGKLEGAAEVTDAAAALTETATAEMKLRALIASAVADALEAKAAVDATFAAEIAAQAAAQIVQAPHRQEPAQQESAQVGEADQITEIRQTGQDTNERMQAVQKIVDGSQEHPHEGQSK